jgi:hypothetical protein
LGFAREYVETPSPHRSYFWTTPVVSAYARLPGWPDAHVVRQGFKLSPEFPDLARQYVVKRDEIKREWEVSGPARRFEIARKSQKSK